MGRLGCPDTPLGPYSPLPPLFVRYITDCHRSFFIYALRHLPSGDNPPREISPFPAVNLLSVCRKIPFSPRCHCETRAIPKFCNSRPPSLARCSQRTFLRQVYSYPIIYSARNSLQFETDRPPLHTTLTDDTLPSLFFWFLRLSHFRFCLASALVPNYPIARNASLMQPAAFFFSFPLLFSRRDLSCISVDVSLLSRLFRY